MDTTYKIVQNANLYFADLTNKHPVIKWTCQLASYENKTLSENTT